MTTEKELLNHYNKIVDYACIIDQRTVPRVFETVGMDLPVDKRVLDLGCGRGVFCRYMRERNNWVVGVDYSWKRIARALENNQHSPFIPYYCDTLQHFLAGHNARYDLITMFDVIEHLEDPAAVVNMARKNLSPDGVLLAAVPLRMDYVAHIQVYEDETDLLERVGFDRVEVLPLERKYGIGVIYQD